MATWLALDLLPTLVWAPRIISLADPAADENATIHPDALSDVELACVADLLGPARGVSARRDILGPPPAGARPFTEEEPLHLDSWRTPAGDRGLLDIYYDDDVSGKTLGAVYDAASGRRIASSSGAFGLDLASTVLPGDVLAAFGQLRSDMRHPSFGLIY